MKINEDVLFFEACTVDEGKKKLYIWKELNSGVATVTKA